MHLLMKSNDRTELHRAHTEGLEVFAPACRMLTSKRATWPPSTIKRHGPSGPGTTVPAWLTGEPWGSSPPYLRPHAFGLRGTISALGASMAAQRIAFQSMHSSPDRDAVSHGKRTEVLANCARRRKFDEDDRSTAPMGARTSVGKHVHRGPLADAGIQGRL